MDQGPQRRYEGGNRLIDGLEPADYDAVARSLTVMHAAEASTGISYGDPIGAVYFPMGALFSVLVEVDGGDCYEVDTVGRDGLVGGELLLGATLASRSVICQGGGSFAQMPVDAFEGQLAAAPAFRRAVGQALQLQWFRTQQTIACNFAHTLAERCARWILMNRDEAGTDEFPLRLEFLSMMVGVRPHLIAEPLAALQGIGAIRYADGVVRVLSEIGLREAVCECYTVPHHHARRLGMLRREGRLTAD